MFGMECFLGSCCDRLLIGILIILVIIWYGIRNHDYWKIKGVPYVKPLPFIGSLLDTMKEPLYMVDQRRYKELGSIHGFYEANNPALTVGDPTLLREILVKDFQNFSGRRVFKMGDNIIDNVLNNTKGEDWKRVRSVISPTFTTGKLKRMTSIFQECGKTLRQNLRNTAEQGGPVDVKKFYGAFTMDVIASSAFSVKIDSHNDPDNTFVQRARSLFDIGFSLKFVIFFFAPRLLTFFGISPFPVERTVFFQTVTKQIIEERKRTGQTRNDFLQLLMDTAKEVATEQKWEVSEKEKEEDIASNYGGVDVARQTTAKLHISIDEIVGNCVNFFLAGYVTTISVLSYATYMMALNPDVQDKLREEVDAVLKETKGELSYDAIQGMKYLDNVISETLRYFPPLGRLDRIADNDYKLGNTGIKIEKGTVVYVPVFAMHRDPKLFPDPETFDPNRFTPEERSKRNQYAYLPFGGGPRNCVGMRFALMEIKVCLAEVVSNFVIKRSPQTDDLQVEGFLSQIGLLQPQEMFVDLEFRKDSAVLN